MKQRRDVKSIVLANISEYLILNPQISALVLNISQARYVQKNIITLSVKQIFNFVLSLFW